VLAELAAVRNPTYAQAPIRIASKSTPHGDTVAAIITALIAANRPPTESSPA
jgi:shikimate kinase